MPDIVPRFGTPEENLQPEIIAAFGCTTCIREVVFAEETEWTHVADDTPICINEEGVSPIKAFETDPRQEE